MKEVIIEGLTEEDIALLKDIVSTYHITVSNFERVEKIKELDNKLTQILSYLND